MTLSLPKDLDLAYSPESQHLELAEVMEISNEAINLLDELPTWTGRFTQSEVVSVA
jgi:hypothetical protein